MLNYSQDEIDSRTMELRRQESVDAEWFNANPDREFRLRRARSVEYSGEAPDHKIVYAILHRDEVEMLWKREYFIEDIQFDPALTDAQIRAVLAGIYRASK